MNNKQKYDIEYDKSHYWLPKIRIKKEFEELIKDRAKDLDKSVNKYIIDLIMEDLNKRDYLNDIDIK